MIESVAETCVGIAAAVAIFIAIGSGIWQSISAMQLRRYQVSVWDFGDCRTELFWTLWGARRWRNKQRLIGAHTYLFWWMDGRWAEMS